jgi:hypothetical protein
LNPRFTGSWYVTAHPIPNKSDPVEPMMASHAVLTVDGSSGSVSGFLILGSFTISSVMVPECLNRYCSLPAAAFRARIAGVE